MWAGDSPPERSGRVSSGDIFVVILAFWVGIIALAWCIDNGSDILVKRRANKKALREAEQAEAINRISHILETAKRHRYAEVMYHRPRGTHRLVRVR
jgi:hypothetical protein